MSNPTARARALRLFVAHASPNPVATLEPASVDASFRSYWRVTDTNGLSRIVMDSPPERDPVGPWLQIGSRLRHAGLHVPDVVVADEALGFVLMEDLGTRAYLDDLDDASADALYADALDALLRMQTHADARGLAAFDDAFVRMELDLMPTWFLRTHLGFAPTRADTAVIEHAFAALADAIREQPRAFMHRDFHSRNLMRVDARNPGIIDFQGALIGPITYDLASLLRDCYIAWDAERVDGWLDGYRHRLRGAHLIDDHVDAAQLRRWFDLTGLQRHVKVLGIFCRLWYRDGKAQYLDDLPLVWRYVIDVATRYADLAPLADLLVRVLGSRDIARPRADAALP